MSNSTSILGRAARELGALVIPAIAIAAVAFVLMRHTDEASEGGHTGDWTCSMHPQVRLPANVPCPICGMDLIPVTQLASQQAQLEQNAGLETEPVKSRELFKEIRTPGKLDYNERRIALLSARIDGRVDRVYADFTGIQVKKNDHLVDIYSPSLYIAQAELLQAIEAAERTTGDKRFASASLEAARTKLLLLGLLPEQVAEIEKSRKQTTHLTVYAPIGGVVIEKNVREQQYVKEGDMLYRLAELDPIWLYLNVFEYDLSWIRYGQAVDVSVEAYPGEVFRGTVVFIDPFLSDESRTVRVRVNLKNPENKLKPAMYASATIRVRLLPDGTPVPTGFEGKFICPMHPEVISDTDGRCTICEMPLERVPTLFPNRAADKQAPAIPPLAPPAAPNQALAIRKSAVLDTGRRRVCYRKQESGAYELVELKLGPLADGTDDAGARGLYFPVLDGLKAGDQVVVRGGFLLDSQRQIEGMPSLLFAEGQAAAPKGHDHAVPKGHDHGAPSSPSAAPAPSMKHQH